MPRPKPRTGGDKRYTATARANHAALASWLTRLLLLLLLLLRRGRRRPSVASQRSTGPPSPHRQLRALARLLVLRPGAWVAWRARCVLTSPDKHNGS